MTNHHISTIVVIALLGVGATACRRANTNEPVSQSPQTADRERGDEDFAEGPSDVHMDSRLAELCDIPTPSFAFDSARIDPKAQQALDKLAECVTEGKAKDEDLRLVGHADPRGDEEYNFALGQRRASSIAKYLKEKGVPSERVETSSRGELDATGSDESSYAKDRRVDIMIAG